MPLNWNDIKTRALTFSRTWSDAAHEDSQGKPFWIDFFEIFGITNKRVASFEHADKKLPTLDRIALVEDILHGLDAPDPGVDALWASEAESRLAAYRAGKVKAIPLSEILAKYQAP